MNDKIEQFMTMWQAIYDEYMSRNFPSLENPRITISYGKKYAKLTREGSVIAFVSIENGDIFMAASWQKPALHARGNVLSYTNGIEALDGVHVRYLR